MYDRTRKALARSGRFIRQKETLTIGMFGRRAVTTKREVNMGYTEI